MVYTFYYIIYHTKVKVMKMRNLKRAIVFLVFIFSVLIGIPSVCYAASVQQTTNVWQAKADIPIAKNNIQTEVVDGKLYVMGGTSMTSADTYNTVDMYDPATNKWASVAPMSVKRFRFQTEVVDGKIYAIGGTDGYSTHPYNSTEVYDPTTNMWTSLAPMSVARFSFESEIINGKIYIIGGVVNNTSSNTGEVYDPTTNKWTSLPAIPVNINYMQTEAIDGKLYVLGSYNDASTPTTDKVMVYDPTTNKWTSLATMSTVSRGFQTKVIDGKIYVIGGYDDVNKTYTKTTEVYDPNTNKWSMLATMDVLYGDFCIEVINGKIYIINFARSGVNQNRLEEYDPTTNKWTSLATLSTIRGGFKTEVLGSEIYAISGYSNSSLISSVEAYSVKEEELSAPTNLSAEAGNTQISLNWNAVNGAASYNVKRSETSGGPYTTISSVSGSAITYNDSNVEPGKTYYYVVTAVSASGKESPNSNEASAMVKVSDKKLKLVLEVKEQHQLSVSDDLSKNAELIWTSSEVSIATVDVNGLVKALKPGNTIITCKNEDGSYIATINVLVVDLDLQLAVDLTVGKTCRLTVDDLKNTANVTWTAYDPAIATVSSKGKVSAVSEGLTYITAIDNEGKEIGRIYIRVRI